MSEEGNVGCQHQTTHHLPIPTRTSEHDNQVLPSECGQDHCQNTPTTYITMRLAAPNSENKAGYRSGYLSGGTTFASMQWSTIMPNREMKSLEE